MWTRYTHLSPYEFLAAMERQGLDSDALEYIRQEFDKSVSEAERIAEHYHCTEDSLKSEIAELEAEVELLEQESEYFQDRNTELHKEVNMLTEEISSLRELICDQNLKLEQLKGLKYE